MEFITKLWQWVCAFLAGNLGIIQAVIKFVKEVITLIIDILFPIMPIAVFQNVVLTVRNFINTIDEWIEKLKQYIIPTV